MGEAVVFGFVVLMLLGVVAKIVVDDRRERARLGARRERSDGGTPPG